MITLELTDKEAAAVHSLYSVGADFIFARIDPETLRGCANILSQFKPAEVRVMRDKITKLADDISAESLARLGITKGNDPSRGWVS